MPEPRGASLQGRSIGVAAVEVSLAALGAWAGSSRGSVSRPPASPCAGDEKVRFTCTDGAVDLGRDDPRIQFEDVSPRMDPP